MFDKIRVNMFFTNLKKGKTINFDTIDGSLKMRIIKDARFVNNINIESLLKVYKNDDNKNYYILDDFFIKNLSDEQFKVFIKKLMTFNKISDVNLSNLFLYFKNIYLSSNDYELKNLVSQLLFYSVKESIFPKEDSINQFIEQFIGEEKKYLLENENMFSFITFYCKNVSSYFGYKNFFNKILNDISNEELKYNMMSKIFKLMVKDGDTKQLYLN